MALYKCKNRKCNFYNEPVEASIDVDTGKFTMNINKIITCPECGEIREKIEEDSNISIGIDELTLGTKRMYESKITKYQ